MPKTNNKAKSAPKGAKYGEWTVKGLAKRWDYLKCRCSCGEEREVNVYSLSSGKSKSCGCKSLELRRHANDLPS